MSLWPSGTENTSSMAKNPGRRSHCYCPEREPGGAGGGGGGHWVVVKVGQREDPDRQALSLVLFQLLRHPS